MGVTRGIWQETLRDDLGLGLMLRVYKNTDQARATAVRASPSHQGHRSPGFPQGTWDKLLRNLPSVHRRRQPQTQGAHAAAREGNWPQTQGPEIPLRTDPVSKCHKSQEQPERGPVQPGFPHHQEEGGPPGRSTLFFPDPHASPQSTEKPHQHQHPPSWDREPGGHQNLTAFWLDFQITEAGAKK